MIYLVFLATWGLNYRRVPLTSTGTREEQVAGVRYRAWNPPSALHPNIGVHAPLVFDLYDSWNSRSIGGCTCSRSTCRITSRTTS